MCECHPSDVMGLYSVMVLLVKIHYCATCAAVMACDRSDEVMELELIEKITSPTFRDVCLSGTECFLSVCMDAVRSLHMLTDRQVSVGAVENGSLRSAPQGSAGGRRCPHPSGRGVA